MRTEIFIQDLIDMVNEASLLFEEKCRNLDK